MVRVHEGALVKAFRNNQLREAFLFEEGGKLGTPCP